MVKIKKKAIIKEKYCVACGTCTKVCPLNLITIKNGVVAKINTDKCVGCGKCAKVCPASVINIEKIEVNQ